MKSYAFVLCVAAAACSGDAEEDDFQGCAQDIPVFAPGLQASGARHSVKLISAEPEEPERYENAWIVELSPADVQLARAQTFMPIHGHDGRVQPVLRALAQTGQFALERLNFTMRGPWEVRLWSSAPEDYVVFHVCVAK